MTADPKPRPRFSIVSAVYNVEPYLPEYIASIEAQRFDLGRVEVIAVDDGSTDGSLALLQAWAERRPGLVTVLTKPNGGEASARNFGLEQARGEWVTFTDPDDLIDSGYLRGADRMARRAPTLQLMAAKPVLLFDDGRGVRDSHPRRWQFDAGDRIVDLRTSPNVFVGGAPFGFFRLDRIRELGLTFDTRIRPNFTDGHFSARYVLSLGEPEIGLLSSSKYLYRKRAAGNSALQTSWSNPRRYRDVLEFGYLDLLERATAAGGFAPAWLQQLIIYELSWYLQAADAASGAAQIPPAAVDRFHELFGEITSYLEPEVIRSHVAHPLRPAWADILTHAYRDEPWHSPSMMLTAADPAMRLQRLVYRFVGQPPRERFQVDGVATRPAYEKVVAHTYFGRTLVHERVVWLPTGGVLRIRLDGAHTPVTNAMDAPKRPRRRRSLGDLLWLVRRIPKAYLLRAVLRRVRRFAPRLAGPVLRLVARTGPYGAAFRNAWVLIDRVYTADDNAERLFEYLRANRPDINAWFVIEKGTPDWLRLQRERVPRVVAHGSFRWLMLMLNASWLVSSHADRAIVRPPLAMAVARRQRWRYAFLQHGITKDDLSPWLNKWRIELFVVSTAAELESVAGDGTGYAFTAKEVRNTGLPRFDRLLAKGRAVRPEDRDVILVAPTWRTYLTLPGSATDQRREVAADYWTSAYHQSWMAILDSEEIAAAAARRGWQVGFMPHPNLQPILPRITLPGHVRALTFHDQDVQELYARTALLVTDYSSVAFNIAYIDGRVVYFQFDRDLVLGGAHLGRKGYFDYKRDGFGPVALDTEAAIAAITGAIDAGPRPDPVYQARIDATFPQRDGRASQRVVQAIEEMSRPYVRRRQSATKRP